MLPRRWTAGLTGLSPLVVHRQCHKTHRALLWIQVVSFSRSATFPKEASAVDSSDLGMKATRCVTFKPNSFRPLSCSVTKSWYRTLQSGLDFHCSATHSSQLIVHEDEILVRGELKLKKANRRILFFRLLQELEAAAAIAGHLASIATKVLGALIHQPDLGLGTNLQVREDVLEKGHFDLLNTNLYLASEELSLMPVGSFD